MSQLLHVHFNQRNLQSKSGENSPSSPGVIGSPGALSPLSMGPSSPQGMPIPRRSLNEPQHWMLNQGIISGSGFGQPTWNGIMLDPNMESIDMQMACSSDLTMEGELSKLSMAVDDDDILFKNERNDNFGPTLAELNAPDADTLLDGLNFDDLYWPAETIHPLEATPSPQTPAGALDPDGDFAPFQVHPSSSFPQVGQMRVLPVPASSVPATSTILEQSLLQPTILTQLQSTISPTPSTSSAPQPSSSSSGGLRELLLRRELLQNSMDSAESTPLGQSLPRSTMLASSPGSTSPRLSSSAPTGQGHNAWESWQQRREAVWQRRDPRPHLLSTGSLAEAGSTNSLPQDMLSPGREISLSMDEGFDSDDLSDHDSSDEESDVSDTESNAGSTSGSRRERFFWQYNVQAKGPKGQRLILAPTQEDPHVLQRPTDPVFSPLCHIQGIKHSGKARKGDGNDLTPNPKKLYVIGKELDRLNKVIAEMTPVADVPSAVKSRSRKEKNKLASRACRLKKKAQHEANKLKLFGLEQEHKRLMTIIEQARQCVFSRMDGNTTDLSESLSAKVERISKYGTGAHKVGGHTTEFVNRVLEKVKQGIPDGGINDL